MGIHNTVCYIYRSECCDLFVEITTPITTRFYEIYSFIIFVDVFLDGDTGKRQPNNINELVQGYKTKVRDPVNR